MQTAISHEAKQEYRRLTAEGVEFSLWTDGSLAYRCIPITQQHEHATILQHSEAFQEILRGYGVQNQSEVRCRKCLHGELVKVDAGLYCRDCARIVFQFKDGLIFEPMDVPF